MAVSKSKVSLAHQSRYNLNKVFDEAKKTYMNSALTVCINKNILVVLSMLFRIVYVILYISLITQVSEIHVYFRREDILINVLAIV